MLLTSGLGCGRRILGMARRIVVIGGVACGPKAAARARRLDATADITIIERGDLLSYAGCGMPYYIQGEIETTDELMSTPAGAVRDAAFFKSVKAIHCESRTLAERIDRSRKVVEVVALETGQRSEIPYDALVLAVGADAFVPPLPGVDLKHVYRLNHPYDAEHIRNAATGGCRKAVIIGAGLIGMEVAEALAARGLHVSLVEMMETVVPAFLDADMALHVEAHLRAKGVSVHTGTTVKSLEGDDAGNVATVVTDKGQLDADLVLMAIGVRPNVKLARDAGLEIGETGAIKVNERLQTSDPSIYAGGDCVENIHRLTGKPCYTPLGSTANKHGRVIGDNVTGGNSTFPGVLGTAIFKAFDINVGRVGLTEKDCAKLGIPYLAAVTPGPDRAHYYPTARPLVLKIVSSADDGRLLGLQAVGPGDVAKRVDVAAVVMSYGGTTRDLANLDLAYAPPYSSAVDLVAHASNVIDNKAHGIAAGISAAELKAKLDSGADLVLLDVRGPAEVEAAPFRDPRTVNIPLGRLRARLGELPRDKEIVTFCKISVRGYEAQTILKAEGFDNVRFLDGGLMAWPYST
jgi:NADPH-dependent 2,4-dienoyl-CoA reductase/sulfur reductase-like enzyme/rhodanese-related sulfurtransferase